MVRNLPQTVCGAGCALSIDAQRFSAFIVHSSCIAFHMDILLWATSQDVDAAGTRLPGRGLGRARAYQRSWKPLWPAQRPCSGTMMTGAHMHTLRVKLGEARERIQRVPGVGYMYVSPVKSAL